MEKETRAVDKLLSAFSTELDQVEGLLQPLLATLDTVRTTPSENKDDFDSLSLARLHITLCYTLNSLFCMYLRTQGVDPATHPIMEHIDRAQDAFLRLRKVEAGIDLKEDPKPKRDVKEYIARINLATEKLSLVVFPEEYELLRTLRGKEKHKQFQDENNDASNSRDKAAMKEDGEVNAKLPRTLNGDSDVDSDEDDESDIASDGKGVKSSKIDKMGVEVETHTICNNVGVVERENKAKKSEKRKREEKTVVRNGGAESVGPDDQNGVKPSGDVLLRTVRDTEEDTSFHNDNDVKKKKSKKKKGEKESTEKASKVDRKEKKKKKGLKQKESKSEEQHGGEHKKKKRKRDDVEKIFTGAKEANDGSSAKKSRKKVRSRASV